MSYVAFGDTDPCQAKGMTYDEASDSCVGTPSPTESTASCQAQGMLYDPNSDSCYTNIQPGTVWGGSPSSGGGGGGGGGSGGGGGLGPSPGTSPMQASLGGKGGLLLGLAVVAAIGYLVVSK